MIATSQFTISVVNDGQAGSQGVSVVSTYPEWRLSDSSTELTGSGTGYSWSTTKPSVPAGKYIWERTVTVLSNNTTVESNPVCDVVMSGIIFDVDANTQAITNKAWSSDISTAINTYDGSTAQSIRDNVSQLTTDLGGITTRVGAAETAITLKADGSTVTTLSNDYSDFKQTMSGFKTTVESNYAQLTDLNNLKVSGNNLYVIKDSVTGYLHASNGSITTQSSTYKEYTSDYIPVVSGSTYIIQSWATPTTTGVSWLAYQFFTDASAANAIGNRTDKYGSDTGSGVDTTAEGMEHLMYKVEAPSTANYLRVSFRAFSDGYCMVEQATMPSEYSVSYKDVNQDISSVRTVAEQTADQFSWIVADGSSSSSVTYTSNALTAMANQIDLTGKVTFNSMDSTLQDRVTTVETNANTALKGMKVYSGTCSTTTDTAEKAVTCSDTDFDLTNGTIITVTFSTASTANAPTLNVNSKGAKAIYFDNAVTSSTNKFRWQAGSVITFQYNGTYWIVLNYQNLDYFTCSTTASTTAKVTTSVTGTFVLCKGTTVTVFFDISNSADAPTLNIGSTGAFAIYYKNAVTSSSNKYLWVANTTVNFTFNGSYWYVNDGGAQLARDYAKSAVDWVSTNGADVLTDKSILDSWKGQAVSGTTTINGGLIQTHTIESQHLATDAIMSSNYDSGTQNQEVPSYNATTNPYHFSTDGTFLDLANGNLYSPNFSVINTVPTGSSVSTGVYVSGHIEATSGTIGGCSISNGVLQISDANISGTISSNHINASGLTIGASQINGVYGTCSTTANTGTKVVTCSGYNLKEGATITVYFYNENTATSNVYLNINSTGAKKVLVGTSENSSTYQVLWGSPKYITFCYTSNSYRIVDTPSAYYGACSTAESTVAKTVSVSNFLLFKGVTVNIKMTYANTAASPTLNVSGTGAKSIYTYGSNTFDSDYNWEADSTISVVFDGQYWRLADTSTTMKALTAATTATNYMTDISNNGVFVHESSGSAITPSTTGANGVHISDDVDIIRNGTVVATYGSSVILGELASGVAHVEIDNDSFDVCLGASTGANSTKLATFGDTIVLGDDARPEYLEKKMQVIISSDGFDLVRRSISSVVDPFITEKSMVHFGYSHRMYRVEYFYGDGVTTQFTCEHDIVDIKYVSISYEIEENHYGTRYMSEDEYSYANNTITFVEPIPDYSENSYLGTVYVHYYYDYDYPFYTLGERTISEYESNQVGQNSVVLGHGEAIGDHSLATGSGIAIGHHSFASGSECTASGDYSRAIGYHCTASDDYSYASGYHCTASGEYSHAQNLGTIANSGQTAIGRYNVEDPIDDQYYPWGHYAFIIGNGYDDARSNAFAVGWDGSIKANNTLIYSPTANCVISHVGMIIMSTRLNTMQSVIEVYGGTTWIQHSGYMLRGASSGVTSGSGHNTSDGGVENVTLTKAQCALPEHGHGVYYKRANITANNSGNTHILCHSSNTGATNWAASNANASGAVQKNHIDNATSSHTNMPPYKNVYIWERTA